MRWEEASCGPGQDASFPFAEGKIRIHLASIGHPVLGDYKYGYLEFNDRYKKKYGITTQLLHASRLEFPQMEGEWADLSGLVLTAPNPEIFQVLDENAEMG